MNQFLTAFALLLPLAQLNAQSDESLAAAVSGTAQTDQVRGMITPAPGQLFAGTALNGAGGNNDTVLIDVSTDTFQVYATGIPIWGATFDPDNQRILYTTEGGSDSAVNGAPLYEIPLATGVPSLLGVINDGASDFRIDGLAWSNGTLYGTRAAGGSDGLYTIDPTTFIATLDFAYADSISGIDADPVTGTIYGVNDSTGELVLIDPVADTISPVVAYPDANETDIDGLAVGGGRAYLIPDDNDPGLIYVYDFDSASFVTPLTAPWGATPDIFSGGAIVTGVNLPEINPVPVNHPAALTLMIIIMLMVGGLLARRMSA